MTIIYGRSNEIQFSYITSDDYPHIGDASPSEWKHAVRSSGSTLSENAEKMALSPLLYLLERMGVQETRHPDILDYQAEEKEVKGYKISLIKVSNNLVLACTLINMATIQEGKPLNKVSIFEPFPGLSGWYQMRDDSEPQS